MKPLILMSGLFLTACSTSEPLIRTEFLKPQVPAVLLQTVTVTCTDANSSRALGECALAYKHGLTAANSQIAAIAEVVK